MINISMEQAVTEFHAVYKQNQDSGIALVKEYMKQYDLPAIELVVSNQREIAKNMRAETHIFSPMKSAFYMLVLLGVAANVKIMDNDPFIYVILFIAMFVPVWDSYSMAQKYNAHKQFADVIEAEMPFFREYAEQSAQQKIEQLLAEQEGSKADLFN